MIAELSIENLGVIASTRLRFGPGLTVLTGETGAGKTLITTAVSQLLGGKPDPGLVRAGAGEALIECILDFGTRELPQRIDEVGAAIEGGEVIVSRSIGARSKAVLGGRAVAASVLSEVVADAVTLHGQHGQTRLMRPSEQRALLDERDEGIGALLDVARQAWLNLKDAQARLAAAQEVRESALRELTVWRALVEDVETVAPTPAEDAELDQRIATLSSVESVLRAARTALALLTEGDEADTPDAVGLIAQARRQLDLRPETPEFAGWSTRLIDIHEQLLALGHELDRYASDLEEDPGALDLALARRAQIGALLRRQGCTLEELLARYEQAGRNIALAADPESTIAELEALVGHCLAEQERVADALHQRRSVVARELSERVTSELRALGLVHASFSIDVTRAGSPTQFGDDEVEFRFTANPGQPSLPLASVASGGELSRVMLALETAVVPEHPRCFIFDEVDAGVGGRAALEVARRLGDLARTQQVIVVTHLAQVAAFADAHIVVEKTVVAGETSTVARALSLEERPRELARMLSGFEESDSANAHARELLAEAAARRAMG